MEAVETAVPAEQLPIVQHIAGGDGPLSPRDAARSLSDWRNKQNAAAREEAPKEAPRAPEAPQAQESEAKAEDANPQEEAHGETQEAEPAEKLSPIDPPASWTKDAKERWQSLPRETQEYLATREQERDRELRRGQNEAAEKLKSLTAREQQAEEVRQRYEKALPALLETLHQEQQREFSDIKTMADVEKLAREDWPRYALWDAQQKKIAAVSQEVRASQERQYQEKFAKFAEFSKKEDARLLERMPELSDRAKQTEVADKLLSMVEDAGLSRDEFARAWQGEWELSIRHSALQEIMAKAALYEIGKAKAKQAVAKPLPPVQKPGVGQSANAGTQQQIQALQKQLSQVSGLKAARIAADIAKLQRQAAR